MISLTCPKCRHGLSDDALDAGACPLCGFPLDGPVVLSAPARGGSRGLVALGVLSVLVLAAAGYAFFGRTEPPVAPPSDEVAAAPVPPVEAPSAPVRQIAPPPRTPTPKPVAGDSGPPAVAEPKRPGARPAGVVMKVDPKITPTRHFDHPDDTAALPDLKTGDRVVLTGRVRVLRFGSVNGKGVLDASALVAEEVVVTGDLNGEAQVVLNAPNGAVTIGGYVIGAARLTVAAPGGSVVVAGSGRVAGGAQVTATAKSLDVKCPVSDGARIQVTLTAGGTLKLTRTEDGAVVTYRKSAPGDPPPAVETGVLRDRARVEEGRLPGDVPR